MFGVVGGRPHYCLKIGARALVWGELSRTWRGRHRYRCVLSPTPPGILKPSPIELNVTDPAALGERLRSLTGAARRPRILGRTPLSDLPRSITLLLPDLAAMATVIQLEQLPARRDEQEALIRWRLAQEKQLPLSGAKLVWQVFPAEKPADGAHIVLVIALQESILAQYESACEAVGLLPQEVAVTSFRLFDLWLKAAGGRRQLRRDIAWVNVADDGLTCFVLHRGRPVFVRTKLLNTALVKQETTASSDEVEKIVRETQISLMACREHHPSLQVKSVIIATDRETPELEDVIGDELGVATEQLHWDHVSRLGWSHQGGSSSLAALPVIAGLV